MNTLSFPGLGIGEFVINKTAFTIFGYSIAWYGIIITCGIIAAFFYALWRGTKVEGIKSDDIIDVTIFTVIFGVIGARLYYVFMHGGFLVTGGSILDNIWDTFVNIIAIWRGGLAIYGGIIGGALAMAVTMKIKKISIFKMFDAAAPGVMLAQAIGRWGNFFNVEAYGTETDLPWRMGILFRKWSEDDAAYTYYTKCMHPTFLYESLWNILGFILINIFYKKKKFDGQIFLMYVAWYGFGRFFIEGLRTDSLYLGVFRVSQLLAAVTFIAAVALLCTKLTKIRRMKLAEASYTPIFADGTDDADAIVDASKGKMYLSGEGDVTMTVEDDVKPKIDGDSVEDVNAVFERADFSDKTDGGASAGDNNDNKENGSGDNS